MFLFEIQIGVAILLDLCLGDPRFLPHPVCLIGFFCSSSEKLLRRIFVNETVAGGVTVFSVLFLTLGLTTGILFVSSRISPFVVSSVALYLLYTCLAARGLVSHSRAVYLALQQGATLVPAREAVSRIVGRDTRSLEREGIISACVETVAENMVDGVTAPLFYAILLSLLSPLLGIDPLLLALYGAMGYKAINTMDSMFGYKNDRYLRFGMIAARVDDLVNFIPARISGLMLVLAAYFLGLNWKNALFIFRRDRLAHASPNAAHPEAAVAGALMVRLGGTSSYFGKKMIKPSIGDAHRVLEDQDILKTNRMMLLGSLFFLISLLVVRATLLAELP